MGSLLEDGPSALYDALSTVLGLEEFVVVQSRLADARKERTGRITACKAAATTLALQAEQVGSASGEPRAVHLAVHLKAKAWDLPALRKLAEGGADATREALDTLKRLSALSPVNVPAVQEAVNRLRACAAQVAALHGTDAARSLARAKLLQQALAFHASHAAASAACPVCGAVDGPGTDWAERSQQEVDALNAEASAVRAAHQDLDAAVRAARLLVRESGVLPSPRRSG